MDKPDALRLAEQLEKVWFQHEAAAELRRLHAVNASLAAALASSCDEQRHELWESGGVAGCERARVAERQRDALLEALKAAEPYLRHADVDYNVYVQCRAAIALVEGRVKAVEEGK